MGKKSSKSKDKKPVKPKRFLYIEVTNDEYEFPLIVADSAQELADKSGVSLNAVYSAISRLEHRRTKFSRFRRVRYR